MENQESINQANSSTPVPLPNQETVNTTLTHTSSPIGSLSKPNHWWSEPMTLFAAVSALSTLLYACFTIPLWYETRNSAQITQHTFEANIRPYVGASDISVSSNLQYILITLYLKNFGSVPAKAVEVKKTFLINGNNIQLSFDDIHGGESPVSIFPDRVIHLEHGFSKQKFFSMFEDDSLVQVDFEITYTDLLGKKYYTHERAIIRGNVTPNTFVISKRTMKYQ